MAVDQGCAVNQDPDGKACCLFNIPRVCLTSVLARRSIRVHMLRFGDVFDATLSLAHVVASLDRLSGASALRKRSSLNRRQANNAISYESVLDPVQGTVAIDGLMDVA